MDYNRGPITSIFAGIDGLCFSGLSTRPKLAASDTKYMDYKI